jgi:hypothetical protein
MSYDLENSGISVFTAALSYLERTPQNLVVKPGIKAIDLAQNTGFVELNSDALHFRKTLGQTNQAFRFLDLPRKAGKFKKSFTSLSSAPRLFEGVVAFKHFSSLTNTMGGLIEFGAQEELWTLTPAQRIWIDVVGVVTSVAVILKNILALKKIFSKIDFQRLEEMTNLKLLKIACKITTLALGVLSVVAFVFGADLIAKCILLELSYFSLILSISKYYHKKLFNYNYSL